MIIAVDPGLTSGVFTVNNDGSVLGFSELTPFEAASYVDVKAGLESTVRVVCEAFTIGANARHLTSQPEALEIIGALRYLCWKYARPFDLQSRNIKSRVDNDTLKRIGWYNSTPGGHVNDAARHAFVAFAKRYPHHSLVKTSLATV